ncbi:beta-1,3-galactosyltransferase 2-like [Esox lucius]|uniref:Hexosyltransferase n=1 Tax=Esox lucius TaxID=8010 RepID=A0A3P8YCJ3_ESOLU|nr:beta-1,3-galactosyltransferase 2-like [Esox lucius]
MLFHMEMQRLNVTGGDISKEPSESGIFRHVRFPRQRCLVVLVLLSVWVLMIFLVTNLVTLHTSLTPFWQLGGQGETPYTNNSEREFFSPYHVAYPQSYQFILDEPDECHDQSPFLLLMVPVAPGNLVAREDIRRTWGNESMVLGQAVRLFFLLGLPSGEGAERLQEEVLLESRQYHDLLQSDFKDSYFNLTIKTMVMLEWLASRCSGASFAMKIDSDMFLNVHNLVHMLIDPTTPKSNFITGKFSLNNRAVRDRTSKWYIPAKVYPNSKFPPYLLGNGYVFSIDLTQKIVEASKHVRAIFLEDVYLGMCLKHLRVVASNPPSSTLFKLSMPYIHNRCHYSTVITTEMDHVSDLLRVWQDLQSPGTSC